MKKWLLALLAFHTLIVVYVLWLDLTVKGDNWSSLLTFFLDLPVSMLFYPFFDFVSTHYLHGGILGDSHTEFVTMAFLTHLIVGGAWWVLVALLVRKLYTKLAR